jgi:hypothetical protein
MDNNYKRIILNIHTFLDTVNITGIQSSKNMVECVSFLEALIREELTIVNTPKKVPLDTDSNSTEIN